MDFDEILKAASLPKDVIPVEVVTPTVDVIPPVEVPVDPKPPVVEPIGNEGLNTFNAVTKKFGKEFKDESEIIDFFNTPNKYNELKKELDQIVSERDMTKKERDEILKKYEENGKLFDPNKYIAPEISKMNQVLLKFKDKYPQEAIKHLAEISEMDLTKKGDDADIDVLIKNEYLKNADIFKDMTDADVKSIVLKKFTDDPDSEMSEWDKVTIASMRVAAKQARLELKSIQDVPMPEPIDIEKSKGDWLLQEKVRQDTNRQQFTATAEAAISNIPDFNVPNPEKPGETLFVYKPEITDSLKEQMLDEVNVLMSKGFAPGSPEVAKHLITRRNQIIAHDQLPRIIKEVEMKTATSKDLFYHNKNHNDAPFNTEERPDGLIDEQTRAAKAAVMHTL
jgi:hypothetical protein